MPAADSGAKEIFETTENFGGNCFPPCVIGFQSGNSRSRNLDLRRTGAVIVLIGKRPEHPRLDEEVAHYQ
jgi:hypothetical protein